MIEYMLDTNICIYLMKRYQMNLVSKFENAEGQISISAVVVSELNYGAEKSMRREANLRAIEAFLVHLDVIPFDRSAAAHYGQIRAELERAGTPCGHADIQIGAHARSTGRIVVTNNRREFDRMPGVVVENWL